MSNADQSFRRFLFALCVLLLVGVSVQVAQPAAATGAQATVTFTPADGGSTSLSNTYTGDTFSVQYPSDWSAENRGKDSVRLFSNAIRLRVEVEVGDAHIQSLYQIQGTLTIADGPHKFMETFLDTFAASVGAASLKPQIIDTELNGKPSAILPIAGERLLIVLADGSNRGVLFNIIPDDSTILRSDYQPTVLAIAGTFQSTNVAAVNPTNTNVPPSTDIALNGPFQVTDSQTSISVDFKIPADWVGINDDSRAVFASSSDALRGNFHAGDALITVVAGKYAINSTYSLQQSIADIADQPRAIVARVVSKPPYPAVLNADLNAITELTLAGNPAALLRMNRVRNLSNYLIQYVDGSVYDYMVIALSLNGYPVIISAVTLPGKMNAFEATAQAIAASVQIASLQTPTDGPSSTPRPTDIPVTPTATIPTLTPTITPTVPTRTPTLTPTKFKLATVPPPTATPTKTFTASDGSFTFNYPVDWEADNAADTPKVILTTARPRGLLEFSVVVGAENIAKVYNTDSNAFTLQPLKLSPDSLKVTQRVSASLNYFLTQLVGSNELNGGIRNDRVNGKPMAVVQFQRLFMAPPEGDQVYIMVDLGNEVPALVSFVVTSGTVPDFQQSAFDIAGSIQFLGGQSTTSPTPPPTIAPTSAAQNDGSSATVIRQWASDASATSQYSDPSWSASQATGEPNTDTCGDSITAWASRSGTGIESLTLYFAQPVTPTQINIYQTYNPGAITSVELLPVDGSTAIELANSADPGTDCPGVFTLDLTLDDIKPINGIKINLDESITGSWNEIDAVELVGIERNTVAIEPTVDANKGDALRQWASDANATSQYGDSDWSALQALGEPDTDTCGDNVTAWASSSSSGKDSLTLTYDKPVIPTQINIHQTYNPGAIISVELLPADGSHAIKVPNSADPGTDCPGVFSLSITLDDIKPINGVRINLDQTITNGWNEIDAVELVGRPSR